MSNTRPLTPEELKAERAEFAIAVAPGHVVNWSIPDQPYISFSDGSGHYLTREWSAWFKRAQQARAREDRVAELRRSGISQP